MRVRRPGIALAALVVWTLAGCAAPARGDGWRSDGRRPDLPEGRVQPNTSKILVAEIAFARLAREEGQWTAFRETAAPDAVMFVPEAVNAQQWLKDRADPAEAVQWQAARLFMSCDGRTGASTGVWQGSGATGFYTTIWQNQESNLRKPERWLWVLDHGERLESPRTVASDMIQSRIASCAGDPASAAKARGALLYADAPVAGAAAAEGLQASADGTMLWSWRVASDTSRVVTLSLWNGDGYDEVVRDTAGAVTP